MGERHSEEALSKLAGAPDPSTITPPQPGQTPQAMSPELQERFRQFQMVQKAATFVFDEGAAIVLDNSRNGSGGTLFVQGASVTPLSVPATSSEAPAAGQRRGGLAPQSKEAEARMLPQVIVATEDYNRLVRMIQNG